jgi:hypothetical protein
VRGAGLEVIAAGALDGGDGVVRVNTFFWHVTILYQEPLGSLVSFVPVGSRIACNGLDSRHIEVPVAPPLMLRSGSNQAVL